MKSLCVLLWCLLLSACAGVKYTVDDGRKVDETLLANIRAYGTVEQRLRPAIVRSADLNDLSCDRQWELPFALATSYGWPENDRVAWVRGLDVDERLTVVATSLGSPLHLGEKLVLIDGERNEDSTRLLATLASRRDAGRPFDVALLSGKAVRVAPFQVCRGYARLAPPNLPQTQDYHWLMSLHSLQLAEITLTDDEALWIVLWSQGLSEEGGARMKTFDYGVKILGTLYNLATLVSGLKGAAIAAQAARSAATGVAAEVAKNQLIEQARVLASQKLREGIVETVQTMSRVKILQAMEAAAVNRGSLSGVARVGATVFDRADQWAFDRALRLHANALAGFSLHQKLVELNLSRNAFALDIERLTALERYAQSRGMGAQAVTAILGIDVNELPADTFQMPLASASSVFSFENRVAPAVGIYANGLIDAMLELPGDAEPKK